MACAPGANPFVERYFLDCVYNLRDYVGFCLGLTAILFWLVAQIPQWVKNYKTKTAEALSPWFLAQWLLGDTFNLLGCLLQGQQLPTTTYTAMYFVVADVFMMMQYIYYGALQRRKEKLLTLQARRRQHHRRQHHDSSRRSHSSSGNQQRSAGSDASRRLVRQPQQQQQQPDSRQHWPGALTGQHDMEYGIDGCTKQRQQQQHSRQQTEHTAGTAPHAHQARDCAISVAHAESSERASASNSCTHSSAAEAAVQPSSCAFQAAVGVASSSTRLLPGTGVSRSVIGVGVLIGLGLVSLGLPTTSMHGLNSSPNRAVAAAVAAHPRSLEAGIPMHSSMHSTSSSNSTRPAAGLTAGHLSAMAYGGAGSSSSSVDLSSGDEAQVDPSPRDWAFVVGTGLGYISSVLYLCSRFSQIHKNYTRQSSEGLALAMFMMAVCANLCTGVGIVMRTFTWQELKEQLPWIIGSLGTITLDMIILWQSVKYGKKGNSTTAAATGGTAAERQQLLHAHHHQSHDHAHNLHHHQEQQQQHPLPRLGQAAPNGGGRGDHMSGHVVVAAAAADYHASGAGSSSSIAIPAVGISAGENLTWLSSSAPVGPGWGVLSHRILQSSSTTGRRHDVAAAADHVDGSPVMAPLLQIHP